MAKLTLNNVGSIIDATTAQTTINNNNDAIETAMEKTLSRDGTTPNEMEATLDMNGKAILNLPAPVSNQSPLRLQELADFVGGGTVTGIPAGGTTGQALSKTSNTSYDIGWQNKVTSVGMSLPADFTVTGSPVTASGTLGATYALTPTGTGAFVKQLSPSLTTPNIGAASSSSLSVSGLTASSAVATDGSKNLVSVTNTGTGNNVLSASPTLTGTVNTGAIVDTSSAATSLVVGPSGATNPSLTIDSSTGSGVAGLRIKNAVTSGRVNIDVTDSGANAALGINAKGTGDIAIANVSTGGVSISNALTLSSTVNKITLTPPATGATLTIIDGTTVTGPAATGTLVTKTSTDTLTNKTYDTAGAGNSFSINGVAATANTGTGSVVRATSPTLVTPALGAATATTINGASLDNNAWTTYTPTITSGGGSFTTVSATGRYKQIGKTVHLQVDVVITTAGTATGDILASYPVSSIASQAFVGSAKERAAVGTMGFAFITTGDATHVHILNTAGATLIASGNSVTASITYEAA